MEICYYPSIFERSDYHYVSPIGTLPRLLQNINFMRRESDKGNFTVMRNELEPGKLSLAIIKVQSQQETTVCRKVRSDSFFVFDYTFSQGEHRQMFDKQAVDCKSGIHTGSISTTMVSLVQTPRPGQLYSKLELIVSRSYLSEIIKEAALHQKSSWRQIVQAKSGFFTVFNLDFQEISLAQKLFSQFDRANGKNLTRIFANSLAHQLIVHTLQRNLEVRSNVREAVKAGDLRKISEVEKMLSSRLYSKYSLDELCQICHMSQTKFKKLFKIVTGLSFSSYYRKIRMEEARRLIDTHEMESMTQLSLQLGYKNLSEFTRAYCEYFEQAPTKYLKHNSLLKKR